jgi:transcriptional regulator with XRE-family HTH domain
MELKSPEDLGAVLQQGRQLKGWSQRELARMLGTGQKWVYEMEQGKPGILMERLFKIVQLTGVTLTAAVTIPDVPNTRSAD